MRGLPGALVLAVLALPLTAGADTNFAGALHAQPVGPLTNAVDFTFVVVHKEATGTAASLRMTFGDGTGLCYLGPAGASTPPGAYVSTSCATPTPFTVDHPMATTTVLSFRHTYPAPREYRAEWYYGSTPPFSGSLQDRYHTVMDALGDLAPVGWHFGSHNQVVAL